MPTVDKVDICEMWYRKRNFSGPCLGLMRHYESLVSEELKKHIGLILALLVMYYFLNCGFSKANLQNIYIVHKCVCSPLIGDTSIS